MEGILDTKGIVRCDNHLRYAGIHLLLEFWGASNLDSLEIVEDTFQRAIEACGATLLDMKFHHFSPYGGISGVAIIMESHFSIHTWPEFGYAAIDIFVCGEVDPYKAMPIFKEAFQPQRVQVMDVKRGIFDQMP